MSCAPTTVYNAAAQELCTAHVTGVNLDADVTPVTYTDNTVVGTKAACRTDHRMIENSGVATFVPISGFVVFDAAAPDAYKVRLRFSVYMLDTTGATATNLTDAYFNGNISAVELKA